jgi:dihydropteroate synthase
MGILNVTPDSFSDGGLWNTVGAAVSRGLAMHNLGADLVDVGGESTRPGASRIPEEEEARRVVSVVEMLSSSGVATSVDTSRSRVAKLALDAGAAVVNDVSGGLADPDMAKVVRDAGCPWILMHSRGLSTTMQGLTDYTDVVTDVIEELSRCVDAALTAGVAAELIVLDPGLGFAKKPTHNWQLLAHLDRLGALGFPVLIGASRKSFLGSLLSDGRSKARSVPLREDATTAITAFAALNGAWGVRVHEVRASMDAALVAGAILGAARNM